MAFWNTERRNDLNVKQDSVIPSVRMLFERKPDFNYFYELEEAVVLDVILDETHPEFANSKLDPTDWPPNSNGSRPNPNDPNYGNIGKIRFRFLQSERGTPKDSLQWAYPIENTGVIEYPLMNEIVIVAKYLNKYYYSKKLNSKSVMNTNASFVTEKVAGHNSGNVDTYHTPPAPFVGPRSTLSAAGGENYQGVLGKYFKFNHHIRTLKKYEGDTILESRFGSSIRFGAYDSVRANDNGLGEYSDGGGNPMILIRNRQAPITNPQGLTAKGYTIEDINKDGSSIHITSGKTVSGFRPTTTIPVINITKAVTIPRLNGDQIVINSDRLIFSSKVNETLLYSKSFVGITSDKFVSITAKGNTTITSSDGVIVFNAKKTYVGVDKLGANDQPALLGGVTCLFLYALCDFQLSLINTHIQSLATTIAHVHASPTITTFIAMPPFIVLWAEQLQSLYAAQAQLLILRSQIPTLQSSRLFLGG
jgi:hypothetical protein